MFSCLRVPIVRRFTSTGTQQKLGFRELTRKYGIIAVGVYSCLSLSTFAAIFSAIHFGGVSPDKFKSKFDAIKESFGFPKVEIEEAGDGEAKEKKDGDGFVRKTLERLNIKDEATIKLLRNILISMGVTKIFSPLKIVATAMITPGVARKLQRMGLDLGTRNVREVTRDARGRIRARARRVASPGSVKRN